MPNATDGTEETEKGGTSDPSIDIRMGNGIGELTADCKEWKAGAKKGSKKAESIVITNTTLIAIGNAIMRSRDTMEDGNTVMSTSTPREEIKLGLIRGPTAIGNTASGRGRTRPRGMKRSSRGPTAILGGPHSGMQRFTVKLDPTTRTGAKLNADRRFAQESTTSQGTIAEPTPHIITIVINITLHAPNVAMETRADTYCRREAKTEANRQTAIMIIRVLLYVCVSNPMAINTASKAAMPQYVTSHYHVTIIADIMHEDRRTKADAANQREEIERAIRITIVREMPWILSVKIKGNTNMRDTCRPRGGSARTSTRQRRNRRTIRAVALRRLSIQVIMVRGKIGKAYHAQAMT